MHKTMVFSFQFRNSKYFNYRRISLQKIHNNIQTKSPQVSEYRKNRSQGSSTHTTSGHCTVRQHQCRRVQQVIQCATLGGGRPRPPHPHATMWERLLFTDWSSDNGTPTSDNRTDNTNRSIGHFIFLNLTRVNRNI
jgi:hypothetical protein